MKNTKHTGLSNQMILLIITISLFLFLYITSVILFRDDNFGSPVLFFNTFFNSKPFILAISLGMTIVMISGSIDISVGSITGLVAMVIAVMLTDHGANAFWAIPVALGIGLAFGIVQGFLVAYMKIQPFIVTLVGLFFGRGLISMIRPVSVPVINDTFMAWSGARYYIPFLYTINRRGIQTFAYLTPASIAVLSALILVIILLKFTRLGRSLYAVGGNAQSALLMGIDPQKTKMFAHIACGLLAGLGGLVFTLCTPSGSPDYGRAYEIQAISSSIIGGAMLSGGVGLPIGTFFGVMINLLVERVVPNLG
jgi:simple sugar transport system permease protein